MFVDSVKAALEQYLNRLNEPSGALSQIVTLTKRIPEKILHFKLPEDKLIDLKSRSSILDSALNAALDREHIRNFDAKSLFDFASKLEEKYSGEIAQLKFFLDQVDQHNSLMEAQAAAMYFVRHRESHEELMRLKEAPASTSSIDRPIADWLMELESEQWSLEEKVMASWFLHFGVLNVLGEEKDAALMARVMQWVYLQKSGIGSAGHLYLGLEFMREQSLYRQVCDQMKFKGNNALFTADLTNQYRFGLSMHSAAIQRLNRDLLQVYQSELEFDEYTPKQRNMVNFFFDEGYLHIPDLERLGLSDRLEEIMAHIYKEHFTSTKDMSLYFRCNRKTIQRDFNELLDKGLVRAMGKGAALRYTVSLEDKPSDLAAYQNINMSDEPVQISLFGSTSGTKKPESSTRV